MVRTDPMPPPESPAPLPEGPQSEPALPPTTGRWRLLRDVLAFQVKLFLDGVLDLALSPVSLLCAAIELLRGRDTHGGLFYDFLRYARRADRWIDRFGAVEERPEGGHVDTHLRWLEQALREQAAKGGITAAAKARIDALLDAAARRR